VKEKWVTLVCALGALALFLAMFLHRDEATGERGDVANPTSAERGANGYRGAMVWLDEEHIRTISLRERFDTLTAHGFGLPPGGNLLIVTLPVATAFRTEEFRPLDGWVRAGNTLLILAALADEPDWAFAAGRPAFADLGLLSGLEFDISAGAKGDSSDVGARIAATAQAYSQPRRVVLVPNGPHPYFDGVAAAVGLSDYPAQAWDVKVPYDGFVLSLAHLRDSSDSVLWTRGLGSGRIIVSGLGSSFTNRALGLENNARLLANIVGMTVGPGGAVLFDDLHQGLSSAYDPDKFYGDRRLYETVAILALLWLSWVLGSSRLRSTRMRPSVPRETELVQVTGGFLGRVLTSDAGALGLFEHFFKRLVERLPRRAHGSPPWELLEAHPAIAPAEVRQLRDWYAKARATRRVPLVRLHNLIRKIDRQITA
jgi:hypothetical protein